MEYGIILTARVSVDCLFPGILLYSMQTGDSSILLYEREGDQTGYA